MPGPHRISHDDPAFLADPTGTYERALAAHWYAEQDWGPAVLRHADVDALLRDHRLRSMGLDLMVLQGITEGPLHEWWADILFSQEGVDHARLRRLVGRAFTPRAVDALRPVMVAVLDDLVAAAGPGPVDAVAALERYAVRVVCSMLGVPAADIDGFAAWADDLALSFTWAVAEQREVVEAAVVALTGYVDRLLDEPGAGLLAVLQAAADDGDRLSRRECVAMVANLILAGTDTTRSQLAFGLATFAAHPDQWVRLSDDPSLAPRAVAEVLRFSPAVPGAPRLAVEPVTIHDRTFVPGEMVSLSFLAANRDPAVWDEPGRFDIGREPGPAFSFGHGAHYCLGAALAKAELEVAFPLLAARWPELRPVAPPTWRPFHGVFGPASLPVTFGSRA